MIEKIVVLSKFNAKSFECDDVWSCISINCPDDSPAKISGVKRLGYLHLEFWDTDACVEGCYEPEHVFNEDIANEIWDFIGDNWEKSKTLMVHCLMGKSRSTAVAAAISKVKFNDDMEYFRKYTPNMLVYRTLLNVANQRKLI